MKRVWISFCGLVLGLGFANWTSAAETLNGTVTKMDHPRQAVVAVVPYDRTSFTLDSDHAIALLTGEDGKFELPKPTGPYLLVAADGEAYRIVDAMMDPSTSLDLEPPPDMILHVNTTHCYCSRLFWNYYYNVFWEDTGFQWGTITRGCGCICR